MDSAYSAPVAGLREVADPSSAVTRPQINKKEFAPVVTEKAVPSVLFSTFKVQIGAPHQTKPKTSGRSTARMPYNNTAIPPPEEITGSASLPRMLSLNSLGFC